MKRIIAMLLVLTMMLALVACGSDKKSNSKSSGLNFGGNQVSQNKITRGIIIGNTYTNNYAGITFTKPASWEYYTDDEIAQTMNMASNMMDMELEDALEQSGSFYDMMVLDPATRTNISIMFENLSATGNTGLSAEDYLEIVSLQLSLVSQPSYDIGKTTTAYLGAQKYSCLSATVDMGGVTMEQRYYVRVVGNYVIGAIVTLLDTPASEVEAMFS